MSGSCAKLIALLLPQRNIFGGISQFTPNARMKRTLFPDRDRLANFFIPVDGLIWHPAMVYQFAIVIHRRFMV